MENSEIKKESFSSNDDQEDDDNNDLEPKISLHPPPTTTTSSSPASSPASSPLHHLVSSCDSSSSASPPQQQLQQQHSSQHEEDNNNNIEEDEEIDLENTQVDNNNNNNLLNNNIRVISLHHLESSSDGSSSASPPQQQLQQQHSSQHEEDNDNNIEEDEEIDLENRPVDNNNNNNILNNNNNRVRQPRNVHNFLPDRPSFPRTRRLKTISEHNSVRSFSSHALNFEDSDDESMFHHANKMYRLDDGDDHDDMMIHNNRKNNRLGRFYGSSYDEDTKGMSSEDEGGGSSTSSLSSRKSISLDRVIVRKVLDRSEERERKLKREKCLNRFGCCSEKGSKRSLICIIVTFGIIAVVFSVLSYLYGIGVFHDQKVKKKYSEGELGIYDDHGLYHNHIDYEQDLKEVLVKPIPLSQGSFPSYISSNLANTIKQVGDITSYEDVEIQQFSEDEIPFFWKTPFAGALMEEIFSDCFKFALASGGIVDLDMMPVIQRNPDELTVYTIDNIPYVNVDLSEPEGIEHAANLGLADSGLADVVSSNLVHYASNTLFAGDYYKGRLFTIVRHPIDRAIVSYHNLVSNMGKEEEQIGLIQYIKSSSFPSNLLTRTLANVSSSSNPTLEDLNLAKEILRRKSLVGIYENLDRSLQLFNNVFQWNFTNVDAEENIDQCISNIQYVEEDKKYLIYKRIEDRGYDLGIESELYTLIAKKNEFDMELYWYAFDLHVAQLRMIESG